MLRDHQRAAAEALTAIGKSMLVNVACGAGKSWAPDPVYDIESKRKPTFKHLRQQRRKLKKISQRRNRK